MTSHKVKEFDMWNSFLKTERKIKNYLLKISDSKLEPYIDDMYHDVLMLSMKRKIDCPERDDSLCLFSAYDVVSSRTRYYQDVIRNSDYLESEPVRVEKELLCSIGYEHADEMVHLARSIAFGLLYTCVPDRIMFSWLMSSDLYKTRSDLSRYYDVSRERARQLEDAGNSFIKEICDYFSDADRVPTFLAKNIKDKSSSYSMFVDLEDSVPSVFRIDYQMNSMGKDVFYSVLTFLWALTVFSGNYNVFEDLKYRGLDPEPVLSLRNSFLIVDEPGVVLENDRISSVLRLYHLGSGECLFSNYNNTDDMLSFVHNNLLPFIDLIDCSSSRAMYIDEISYLLNVDVLP